jgi:hypothetical protein
MTGVTFVCNWYQFLNIGVGMTVCLEDEYPLISRIGKIYLAYWKGYPKKTRYRACIGIGWLIASIKQPPISVLSPDILYPPSDRIT